MKQDTNPHGVALNELLQLLQSTSFKSSINDNTLVAREGSYTTRVEVIEPENRETIDQPIQAMVRVTTELPSDLAELFKDPEMTVSTNRFATLGALTSEQGKVYIGSRLTIYEGENAWETLHMPLLLFSVICAS